MTQSQSNDKRNQQSERKPEAEIAKDKAGKGTGQSSHEHMSRQKAGEDGGAGGGAKQEQKHR